MDSIDYDGVVVVVMTEGSIGHHVIGVAYLGLQCDRLVVASRKVEDNAVERNNHTSTAFRGETAVSMQCW